MTKPPDATAWIPEKPMLELCDVSRSTFRSWIKSGLNFDMAVRRGAYGLDEVVCLMIFASARKFLAPKELIAVWDDLQVRGETKRIIEAARDLEPGDQFDLVLDPKYSSLGVALDVQELVDLVRDDEARPVVVIDLARSMYRVLRAFGVKANNTPRPSQRRPGRPASAERLLSAVEERS